MMFEQELYNNFSMHLPKPYFMTFAGDVSCYVTPFIYDPLYPISAPTCEALLKRFSFQLMKMQLLPQDKTVGDVFCHLHIQADF